MLANEALEVLALRPGATPVQIKAAYRDLVKVWHPDRFGSDVRLRQKAEEKLQQINEAYRVLQANGDAVAGDGVVPSRRSSSSSSSSSARVTPRRRAAQGRVATGWFYGIVGIALVSFAGLMAIEYRAMRAESSAPAVVQPVASPSVSQGPGGVPAGRGGRAGGGDSKGAAGFSVRSLSEAETARLEEACEPQRERLGQTAYQVCMAAQVGLITNPAGRPDLSALNGAEHESIEKACADARWARGVEGYNRCLNAKMAEWAAEPARPRLSTLNAEDRSSVELACMGAKEREGPAAYDRCLVRFMKALAETK